MPLDQILSNFLPPALAGATWVAYHHPEVYNRGLAAFLLMGVVLIAGVFAFELGQLRVLQEVSPLIAPEHKARLISIEIELLGIDNGTFLLWGGVVAYLMLLTELHRIRKVKS